VDTWQILKNTHDMCVSNTTRLMIDVSVLHKLLLYVDDMLAARSRMKKIVNLKAKLAKKFSMKDLGPAMKILGMRITREKRVC